MEMPNKAIKVMRYTRRFWYEVWRALLVQWGTPYCRRYGTGEHRQRGSRFIIIESCLAASNEQFSYSVMVLDVFNEKRICGCCPQPPDWRLEVVIGMKLMGLSHYHY